MSNDANDYRPSLRLSTELRTVLRWIEDYLLPGLEEGYVLLAGRAGGQTILQGVTLEGGLIVNGLLANADTSISGDTIRDLFFLDASVDRIGINTGAPEQILHIVGNVMVAGAVGNAIFDLRTFAGQLWRFQGTNTSGALIFRDATAGTNPLSILPGVPSNTLALTVSGSEGRAGIGTGSPQSPLHVTGMARFDANDKVSSIFSKTNTTLADITGLAVTLTAGRTYSFLARLIYDASAVGGHKYAMGGTCTATAIIYHVRSIADATNVFVITSRQTALGGAVGQAGSVAGYTEISGTITVNAGGTLVPQFAQNVASGTSSILVGSTFHIKEIA